jgi:shikimate kinase
MGTGKSSVGRILAKKLGWSYLDTDEMIERQTGYTVAQLFSKGGEQAFRQLESETVKLVSLMDKAVIATGGGVPLREENLRELEKTGVTVCLEAKPETILERLRDEVDARPLLQGQDPYLMIHQLLSTRRTAYARARHRVETDGLSPEAVADRVLAAAGLP